MSITVTDQRGNQYRFPRAKSYRLDSSRGAAAISLWSEDNAHGEFLGIFVNPSSIIPQGATS